MDLRHLHHILLLADELNFSRAAKRAHLTQSAFSRSIQSAEMAAGARFFDRTQRNVTPTAIGRRLIERGRRILFEADDLDRELALLAGARVGTVRVGAGTTIAASILPGVARSFHLAYPGVVMKIVSSHWRLLHDDLLTEKIDFFVSDISELEDDHRLTVHRLAPQRASFFCRAGHPLLARVPLGREALREVEYCATPLPAQHRRWFAELLGFGVDDELPIAVESDSMDLLREFVTHTDAVLLNLAVAVAPLLAQGRLIDLRTQVTPSLCAALDRHSPWGIVQLRGRTQSPATLALIDAIEAAARATIETPDP